MIYQVLSPFVTAIEGDSYKEAIKNFVKINYNMAIQSMIIQDQMNHYQAKMKYYKENNKDKIGITVYPYSNVNQLLPNQLLPNQILSNTSSNSINSIIPNQIIPNQMLPMLINSSNNKKIIQQSSVNNLPINQIAFNQLPINQLPLTSSIINNQTPFNIKNFSTPIISYI